MFVNFSTDDKCIRVASLCPTSNYKRGGAKSQGLQCGNVGTPFAEELNCFICVITHCKGTYLVQLVVTVAVPNYL